MVKNLKQLSASQIEEAIAGVFKLMTEVDYNVKLKEIIFAGEGRLESIEAAEEVGINLTITRYLNTKKE